VLVIDEIIPNSI